ncbi:hypothetical protein STPH1_7224 [Streptomyces sp. OM5714]|nr:hypothetical protein STPH1_7224 [Streptomyces sp. OM5714]
MTRGDVVSSADDAQIRTCGLFLTGDFRPTHEHPAIPLILVGDKRNGQHVAVPERGAPQIHPFAILERHLLTERRDAHPRSQPAAANSVINERRNPDGPTGVILDLRQSEISAGGPHFSLRQPCCVPRQFHMDHVRSERTRQHHRDVFRHSPQN